MNFNYYIYTAEFSRRYVYFFILYTIMILFLMSDSNVQSSSLLNSSHATYPTSTDLKYFSESPLPLKMREYPGPGRLTSPSDLKYFSESPLPLKMMEYPGPGRLTSRSDLKYFSESPLPLKMREYPGPGRLTSPSDLKYFSESPLPLKMMEYPGPGQLTSRSDLKYFSESPLPLKMREYPGMAAKSTSTSTTEAARGGCRENPLEEEDFNRELHEEVKLMDSNHSCIVIPEIEISPIVIEPTEKHKATFVFLHSLNQNGSRWAELMQKLREPYLKIVIPTANKIKIIYTYRQVMQHAWYDQGHYVFDTHATHEQPAQIRVSNKYIHSLIDEEIANGIPPEKIIVGGFGQGATLAIHTVITHPKKLGGIICMSGWVPQEKYFYKNFKAIHKDVPILQCHGTKDDIVRFIVGNITSGYLRNVSANAEFKIFQEGDHEITQQGYDDMKQFLNKHLNP